MIVMPTVVAGLDAVKRVSRNYQRGEIYVFFSHVFITKLYFENTQSLAHFSGSVDVGNLPLSFSILV